MCEAAGVLARIGPHQVDGEGLVRLLLGVRLLELLEDGPGLDVGRDAAVHAHDATADSRIYRSILISKIKKSDLAAKGRQ